MGRLMRLVHLYVSGAAGLFIVLAGVSGGILVFREELDALLLPELMRVTPAESTLPIDMLLARVRDAHPADAPSFIRLPQAPAQSLEVWTGGEEGPRVYVDPYRGDVLGAVDPEETFTGFLFSLHAELLGGETGALIAGWGAVLLVVLCITGIVMWWPSVGRLRGYWVRWSGGWRRVSSDLHRAGGFWSAALLLVVAVTGASFVFHEQFRAGLDWITRSPSPPVPPGSTVVPGAEPVSVTAGVRAANAALPGGAVTWVYLPASPEAPLVVRKRLTGELHPNGRSFVYVDQYTGAALLVDNAVASPLGARIYHLLYPLHIGRIGGIAGKVLYAVLGFIPLLLGVTGLLIWLNRRAAARRALERRLRAPSEAACVSPG